MQYKNLLVAASLLMMWQALVSSTKNPNNPPVGNTGAPSETTCAKSGCHSGGSFNGTTEITGLPDTIAANTSYTIVLKNTSNAVRSGFQLTCLDKANTKCGTLTAGTGSSIITNNVNQRQYIRQSAPKTLANGTCSWTFTWKSPVTLPADSAVFYFTVLEANGNGGESGDNVKKNSKKVITTITSAVSEPNAFESIAKAYPVPMQEVLHIDLNDGKSGQAQLFDAKGNMVRNEQISGQQQIAVGDLPAGMYILKIKSGGHEVWRKIMK